MEYLVDGKFSEAGAYFLMERQKEQCGCRLAVKQISLTEMVITDLLEPCSKHSSKE